MRRERLYVPALAAVVLAGMISAARAQNAVPAPAARPVAALPAASGVEIRLTLQGLPGGQGLPKDRTVRCTSVSHSMGRTFFRDSGDLVPGGHTARPFRFTKPVDWSSPLLAFALVQESQLGQAVFRFYRREPGAREPREFYSITLEAPRVTLVNLHNGPGGQPDPQEEIALHYSRMAWKSGATSVTLPLSPRAGDGRE